MEEIKVLLVDDQKILLDGLKAILESDPGIKVASAASSGKEAIGFIERNKTDVVLMDIRMPEMNGVECTKIIKEKWPDIAVLVLTTFDDEEYIVDALRNGACGYLLKDISGEKLVQAVKDAYRGDTILPSKVAVKLVGKAAEKPDRLEDRLRRDVKLSEREVEIARMLAEGFTNRQIASAIFISEGTVKNYTSAIYGKLGVADRTAAVIKIRHMMGSEGG